MDFMPAAVLLASLVTACTGTVDWQRKDAWRMCGEAIADWPEAPTPPCEALHMCANEAPLSPDERDKLGQRQQHGVASLDIGRGNGIGARRCRTHANLALAGQRRNRDAGQIESQHAVLCHTERVGHPARRAHLDSVALAVVDRQRMDGVAAAHSHRQDDSRVHTSR
jgi:hypothetical protein